MINHKIQILPYPTGVVKYDASGSAVVTERYEYDNVSVKDFSAVSDAGGTIQTFSYHYARPYQGTAGGSKYVQTKTYLNPSGSNAVTEYAYHDALGRPVETASSGVDASGRYVHTMKEYDLKGRVSRKWLPAVGGTSAAELGRDAFAGRSSATYGDGYAYSETAYDGADRPVFTLQPGSEWHSAGKGKAVEYVPNTANSVKLYHAALEGSSLVKDGYYPANTLYGELHTDEDGHTIAVYKDKRGRKVLERRDGNNDTYFVYDDLDRLRFVLSPEYQYAGYKAEYAYEYRYDRRGNMVKRILPGCGVDQYWYDGTDRLTFESVPASTGFGYRFRLYDKFGRQCVQGLCTNCERSFSGVYRAPRVARTQGGGFAGTGYALDRERGLLRRLLVQDGGRLVRILATHIYVSGRRDGHAYGRGRRRVERANALLRNFIRREGTPRNDGIDHFGRRRGAHLDRLRSHGQAADRDLRP